MSSIEPIHTSIIGESKIIVASNNGIIRCADAGTVEAAARFCRAFDELRNDLRPRRTLGEVISLREQRQAFRKPLTVLQTLIQAAS